MKRKRYQVPFRRRRQGKTDYRQRLRLLKSGKPRVVIRRSNKNIRVQFVVYDSNGDRVVSSVIGNDLRQYGWDGSLNNMPASYLIGLLAGKRALTNDISESVLDIGQHESIHKANIYGVLKGVLDAGVDVPHGEAVIPDEARLNGEHIGKDMLGKVISIKEKIEADYER